MYEQFYGLKENPFRLNPDPAYLCMTLQHREALSGLVYSVCTRPGLTVLTGEAGTGKTTLLYTLLELLHKRRYISAMCTNPTLTRAEFYDLVVAEFGIEISSSLKSRQLLALQQKLQRNRAEGRPSILIVDEAQRLPAELLEEVRLLLNMETPREKLLDIILAGQPELMDVLHRPEMRQLKQRISCICKLGPLSIHELREYLQHRLAQAGLAEQSLFSEPALDAVYKFSQGIPRLVNSLCDSALRLGFALQSQRITQDIVEEAAQDLDLVSVSRKQAADVEEELRAEDYDLMSSLTAAENGAAAVMPGKLSGDFLSRDAGSQAAPAEVDGNRQRTLGFLSNLMHRWS